MSTAQRLEQAASRSLDQAPVGLVSFEDDGRIVHANAYLHRLLGLPAGALIGRALERMLTPASRVFHSTHFFPLLRLKGSAEEIHLTLRTEADDDLPMMVSAVREAGEHGAALNHCALMSMGQRKRLESALLEARRVAEAATASKDQFLAVVSHELRSPLNAILGWAGVGLLEQVDEAMRRRAFETIERNAKAQARLIDDLLDISRIVTGKMRLSPRAMDLAPVIEAAVDTVRPSARAKGIHLVVGVDRQPHAVYADPDRIQQIAWNLLSNAIKFTPKGGTVQTTLARAGSVLRLQVSDTGPGIAVDQLPYVFDRFWQADTLDGPRAGLGLGLSICKSLVELHGGAIQVGSAGVGQGACFTLDLPLAIAAGTAAPVAEPEPGLMGVSLRELRVLVVDDDEDARVLMKLLLEGAGAQVSLAGSCDEALQCLAGDLPQVLLSDVGLPGKDGFELIRLIRAGAVPAAQGIVAIAVTGLARPQDRVRLLRAGFQAHLSKPVEPAEVTALVQALVRRAPAA